MENRHARVKRVRARVVAGATGLFLVALGAVTAFGRQPAASVTHASTSTTTNDAATQTQTYDDSGSYSDDETYAPSPMTSRSS